MAKDPAAGSEGHNGEEEDRHEKGREDETELDQEAGSG